MTYKLLCTIAIFIFLAGATSLPATTVITLIAEKWIMLAADSRVGRSYASRSTTCKIRSGATMVASLSGYSTFGNFNAKTIISKATVHRHAFAAMDQLKIEILHDLPAIIATARKSRPNQFVQWTKNHVPFIQVILASGTELGVEAAMCTFFVDSSGKPRKPDCQYTKGEAGTIQQLSAGETKKAMAIINADSRWGLEALAHPTEWLNRLVNSEIKEAKRSGNNNVGGPVAIVRVDKDGPRLIQPGVCASKGIR